MEYKDYYKIMGLDSNATPEELKRAYRKLARKFHPDVSKETNAEQKFKELGEAYETLKDPAKRDMYDKYGAQWKQQGSQPPPSHAHAQQPSHSDFEDFINSMFRQREAQEASFHQQQNLDIHAKLSISLEDSFNGAEKVIQLPTAGGDVRSVKVKIPQGITPHQQIRLKGQAKQLASGHAGDLYIEILINPHPFFRLENKNIFLNLPVSPWEATLGSTVSVPTLAGLVKLKIPPNSQNNSQLRLKGRGLPGKPAGDQIINVTLVIPKVSNEQVNALYKQIADAIDFNPRQSLGVD